MVKNHPFLESEHTSLYRHCYSVYGMGLYAKLREWQELLPFLSGGGGKKLFIVLQCIFGRDFLSSRTTIVSGIKNSQRLHILLLQ